MSEEENNSSSHPDDSEKRSVSTLSKFLTLILRHQPHAINAEMDNEGWLSCTVDELVNLINERKRELKIRRDDIQKIVDDDPKGRYEISDNHIRATYGHSVKLNPLEFPDDLEDLPEYLYYATNNYQLDTMLRLGLLPREKRDRQFLHLSVEIKDAYTVAKYHSRNPKLVRIDVSQAFEYGIKFRKVAPLIVVCEEVPSQFLEEIPLPEELQYLIHLNPERKYQKNRGRHQQGRRYREGDRKSYSDDRRGRYSQSSSRSGDYKGGRKPYSKPNEHTKKDEDYNVDMDSADFGDVDDLKKKAKNKSTIHFETQSDEDVEFT